MKWINLSSSTSTHYCLSYLGISGSIHLHVHRHALAETWYMTVTGLLEVAEINLETTNLAVACKLAILRIKAIAGVLYIAVDTFEKDINNTVEIEN
jgi:hypothetical protein